MEIVLNGKKVSINDETTLLGLLKSRKICPEHVVIEYNYNIPKRNTWESIIIEENANIEILKFMGGG